MKGECVIIFLSAIFSPGGQRESPTQSVRVTSDPERSMSQVCRESLSRNCEWDHNYDQHPMEVTCLSSGKANAVYYTISTHLQYFQTFTPMLL